MLGAGFAEAGSTAGPVVRVLLIVVLLALVIALLVFLGPLERFVNRRTREKERPAATRPAGGVLWVDDRPEHNARLLNGLRDQGVRVDVARTITEALEHLGEREHAIIVVDVSRAEQPDDGVRLLNEASGAIPVVIFSRYASAADAYRDGPVAVVSSEAEIKDWLRSVDLLP